MLIITAEQWHSKWALVIKVIHDALEIIFSTAYEASHSVIQYSVLKSPNSVVMNMQSGNV
jgi:hypothetical protein